MTRGRESRRAQRARRRGRLFFCVEQVGFRPLLRMIGTARADKSSAPYSNTDDRPRA